VRAQAVFEEFKGLALEREHLKEQISRSQLKSFQHEVSRRRQVLARLEHCTADEVLTIKGKAAAEVRGKQSAPTLVSCLHDVVDSFSLSLPRRSTPQTSC